MNGWPHADTGAIDRLRVRSPDTRRWYASLQRNVTVERRAGLCSKTTVRTRAGYSGPQSVPITSRRLDSPAHWAGCCFRTVSVRTKCGFESRTKSRKLTRAFAYRASARS